MPLSDSIAFKIANALQESANKARLKAKCEEQMALKSLRFPALLPLRITCVNANLMKRWQRFWSAQGSLDSIDACCEALEGLVWLAAGQHDRGLDLLERGIRYRAKIVSIKHQEGTFNAIKDTLGTLINEDLPAIRGYRAVNPGVFERVCLLMSWESCASPFIDDMLTICSRVKSDVAAALEVKSRRIA